MSVEKPHLDSLFEAAIGIESAAERAMKDSASLTDKQRTALERTRAEALAATWALVAEAPLRAAAAVLPAGVAVASARGLFAASAAEIIV